MTLVSNEAVITALQEALAFDPSNVEVRAHLAGLLHQDGHTGAALAEAGVVLAQQPDHLAALRVAQATTQLQGDSVRAASYARVIAALTGRAAEPGAEGVSDGLTPAMGGGARASDHGGAEGADDGRSEVAALIPDTADDLLASWEGSAGLVEPDLGHISPAGVTLADVGGMTDVKKRLNQSFLMPMRNPELRAAFGKSLRGGLLLWGPPGCGKTFVARAVAGELGAQFYEVGLADVLDMYVGSSERNLHSIFDTARRNTPCVLFFDELDALGHKRSQLRGAAVMRGVVNQMLAELDGASTENDGVFVLAATNHPWDVDSALLRPGRFDRSVLVLPPDREAREAIFALHLQGRPTDRIDLRSLATSTEGFSGADAALVCEQATESAMEESMASGVMQPITQRQLVATVGQVRPSIGEWMEAARNYALYSNSSGEYDELNAYFKKRRR